jgi:hypothetical protein
MYEGGVNVPSIVVNSLVDAADRGSESLALIVSPIVLEREWLGVLGRGGEKPNNLAAYR